MPSHSTTGTVYLLHFSSRYRHAGHYMGWSPQLAERLTAHAAGNGARLLAVIREHGISFELVRTWPGTRTLAKTSAG